MTNDEFDKFVNEAKEKRKGVKKSLEFKEERPATGNEIQFFEDKTKLIMPESFKYFALK